MFHTIVIAGNGGGDPSMRYTPNGKAVTSFSVAVNEGFGENKKTVWFRVSAWDKQAETCNQYLRKGSKVLVEGRLTADDNGGPRVWESNGRTGASFEISASTVRFLSSREESESGSLQDEIDSIF